MCAFPDEMNTFKAHSTECTPNCCLTLCRSLSQKFSLWADNIPFQINGLPKHVEDYVHKFYKGMRMINCEFTC